MITLVVTLSLLGALEGVDQERLDFFEKKVRPVLVAHCYRCHSPVKKGGGRRKVKGGLALDSRAGWMKGGDSGAAAIVPGKPDESLLVRAIRYEDPDLEMPPKGKLPDAVIRDLEKWVAMGASDPRDEGAARAEARPPPAGVGARLSWPYTPPRSPPVPAVGDVAWPLGEVDWFIQERLERTNLQPVADADRRTLLRRAYLTLTGLPPRPEAVESFVEDSSADAFARRVDRLLASPDYGERWGRHWLDVARFAESTGGGRSQIFRNAWRYRDYVIESLNRDKPYDRFVAEQVGGDLIGGETVAERREALVATGFLALGPKNLDNQDKELLRMDVVDEQLDTLGRAFLGMTLGCARCHDHKFDPIPTEDYYALAGILRSTKTLLPGNVSGFVERPLPGSEALIAAEESHQKKVRPREKRLKDARGRLAALKKKGPKAPLRGIVVDDRQAEIVGDWQRSTFHPEFVGEGYIHDGDAGKGAKWVTFVPDLPRAGLYEVRISYTPGGNRAARVPVTVRYAGAQGVPAEKTIVVDQRQPPAPGGRFISLGRFRFDAGRSGSVRVSNRDTKAHVIADSAPFIPVELLEKGRKAGAVAEPGGDPSARNDSGAAERERVEAAIETLEKELRHLKANAPAPPPLAVSVRDEESAADCPLFVRGDVHTPGKEVPRGFLGALGAGAPRISSGESGRRELARWLVRPDNPLTARVVVNRIWHHLFGAGIVRSVDNFGSRGEGASHPELLDWLAVRFVEDGWSVKKMIRRLMLSRVWRLSSSDEPRAAAVDPANRLFWRMHRRRLDAEVFRDSLLLLSGRLDRRRGGPGIRENTTSEFGYRFSSRRRSVYLPVLRNTLHELLETFDVANPNLVVGRRSTSTLPTQALYLMNSPFVLESARLAAEDILGRKRLDDRARVRLAYARCLGRPPRPAELELALRHLRPAAVAGGDGPEAWSAFFQALFASIDFRYSY
ncbi:MAG: DUF1553 domain-containing protein [Planctomycetota bacterium]|nr:DUF1553 domain-containing protein [Planctomycetota bacterium]